VLFDKIASVYFISKHIYILALEMASPGNQQCASCIVPYTSPPPVAWLGVRIVGWTKAED